LKKATKNEVEAYSYLIDKDIPSVAPMYGTCIKRNTNVEYIFMPYIETDRKCHELMKNPTNREQIVPQFKEFLQAMAAASAYDENRHAMTMNAINGSRNLLCQLNGRTGEYDVLMFNFKGMHFPGASGTFYNTEGESAEKIAGKNRETFYFL